MDATELIDAPAVSLAALCPPLAGGAPAAAEALARGQPGTFMVAEATHLPPAEDPAPILPRAAAGLPALRLLADVPDEVPAARLHILRDVLVHTTSWTVFHEGRLVIETLPSWQRADAAAFLRRPRFAAAWAAGVTAEIDHPMLAACSPAGQNYWHWHADCLAGLLLGREALGPGVPLLLPRWLAPFQRGSLELLPGSGAAEAVRATGLVRCARLAWPSTLGATGGLTRFAAAGFDALRAAAAPATTARRIYVARFDAPGRRGIDNERELAAALEGVGFEVVVPRALGYAAQAALFAGAGVVVGPHGAGLTNAAFMPPGALLVELHPEAYGVPVYAQLARLRGLRWRCWTMPTTDGHGQAVRSQVDVGGLLAQLEAWGALA